jgi:hypothetical protein
VAASARRDAYDAYAYAYACVVHVSIESDAAIRSLARHAMSTAVALD